VKRSEAAELLLGIVALIVVAGVPFTTCILADPEATTEELAGCVVPRAILSLIGFALIATTIRAIAERIRRRRERGRDSRR
jgi:hypothetical protein